MANSDNFIQINRFDHERIPERVVHARGAGAHGTFKLYESAEDVTSAGVLTDTSRTTPVFVRFSTVLGSRGSKWLISISPGRDELSLVLYMTSKNNMLTCSLQAPIQYEMFVVLP